MFSVAVTLVSYLYFDVVDIQLTLGLGMGALV